MDRAEENNLLRLLDRRIVVAASSLVALLAFGYAARQMASRIAPPLDFDMGPSTGRYLDGFTESEERLPVTFRWTREQAAIALPVEGAGSEARLKLRLARFLPGSAQVRLFVDGVIAGTFSVRSGRFRTVERSIALPTGSSTLSFLVQDPDPERLGIAIDWIRIENVRWRLPRGALAPPLLLSGVFVLALALGFSLPRALAIGACLACAQAIWFARDPFAMAHVHHEITAVALATTALLAAALRSARLVPLLYLLGLLMKSAVLFHPSYFYPDVRVHRRHLEVMRTGEGSLVERGIAAQKASGTAYPRRIAGRDYAFPYSPIFYVPFLGIERDARGIESIMKHVGLLLAALELPLVFLLARYLFDERVATWAAFLTVFLPPIMSRVLYAQWPTLAGHLLDILAIFFAARMVRQPGNMRALALYGVGGFFSSLVYVSSLINLSLLTSFLAASDWRRAPRLLAMWTAIGLATFVLLYLPFGTSLFKEIIPTLAEGSGPGAPPGIGAVAALCKIHMFYGFGFPTLAIAGFLLARNKPETFRILAVYAATFIALVGLRTLSGTFKDLKELVFIGPFVATTAGLSLVALASRGRSGKFAAIAVAVGLAGFGLARLGEYATLHTTLAALE